MKYLEWNNAIGMRFFNPDKNGTRVFIYVTTEMVNEIGASHMVDIADFCRAVKEGPQWITRHRQSICQQALQALNNWRARDLEYPPYIAYLALFVLADTVDTGFARHAYYPGLRTLIGEEPQPGMYPSFNQMYYLWDDLAVWSNQDKCGEWGEFHADIVGEWMHVGLPRAQTILTDEERESLCFLFAENGFDPNFPPSDVELACLLAHDPHHRLRAHTKDLLRSTNENYQFIREALIEAILDELQDWDASIPPHEEGDEGIRSSLGNLRLSMILDTTAHTVQFLLRCRSNREYPEEGLKFTGGDLSSPLYCFDYWHGWSTPLFLDEAQTSTFDPVQLDLCDGTTLMDREHSWRVSLVRRPVRVMVNASPYGFSGFLEESQLPRGMSFYLLFHDSCSEELHEWLKRSCEGFQHMDINRGLPAGWQLYFIERALPDDLIAETYPYLAFPRSTRIQLRGGLE